jgi:hypothetical protein
VTPPCRRIPSSIECSRAISANASGSSCNTRFDACGKQSAAAFHKAEESNTRVPSLALAVSAQVEVGMAEVVSAFWTDDSMTPKWRWNSSSP